MSTRVAMVGNYVFPWCSERYWADTLEDLGCTVTRIQEDKIKPGTLSSQVEGHQLFIWVKTWDGFVTHKDLDQIRALGIPSVNLHLDLFVPIGRRNTLDTDPRWRCDYVLTADGDPHSQEVFERHGINHYFLPPGVYKPEAVYGNYRPELAHDLTFVGGGVEYAHREWPYRKKLAQWLMDNYSGTINRNGLNIPRYGKYGHPQRLMRGQDLNDLYASAKIAIGDSLCIDFSHKYYVSDRLFESVGRGAFTIFPHVPGIEEFLEDGKEIIYYDFNDWDGLREKIEYYLDPIHEDERQTIRLAGHERVKREHTYHNRLQTMLNIIFPVTLNGENIPAKHIHPDVTVEGVAGTFQEYKVPLRINLGSGADPLTDFVNVDMLDRSDVDVKHNLMNFPYPFEDESATEIRAIDVVEHLDNFTDDKRPAVIAFIEECYRILKPGGELYLQTPGYQAAFRWTDPTHVRPFTAETFTLWDEDTPYGKTNGYYSHAKFKVRVEELENHNLRVWLVKR
jgi:hypothetical protein